MLRQLLRLGLLLFGHQVDPGGGAGDPSVWARTLRQLLHRVGCNKPVGAYLILTTASGSTTRIGVTPAGGRTFYAYTTTDKDPVVQWTAYNAAGQELASGRPSS